MIKSNKPTISVVIATYNSERTIKACLDSLAKQDFPQKNLQLIISDGGSTDRTVAIAKKPQAQIVFPPKNRQGAEYNKGYGFQFATGTFILCIDHDNILPHNRWLSKMLAPLLAHHEVVASEPLRYHYDPHLTLLDRYFALFGANDPVPYYLGKADRMDYIHNNYNLLGKSSDQGAYYLVQFDKKQPSRIPTLGANGFLIRRSFFIKSDHKPGHYYHIDINVDLVSQGYTHYAFIKDDITHLTNSSFFSFIDRRKHFVEKYYIEDFSMRRYSVYQSEDRIKLTWYIFYSITIIRPLIDSMRGYLIIHDIAWFIHPFMCLAMLYIYGLTTIKNVLKKRYDLLFAQ